MTKLTQKWVVEVWWTIMSCMVALYSTGPDTDMGTRLRDFYKASPQVTAITTATDNVQTRTAEAENF